MDHDGDVTLPGFFGTQHASIVPSHDWKHVPLGKAVIREVANEAVVDFKLNLKIEPARQWHEAIRFDLENPPALQEYSYGFSIARGGSRPGEVRSEEHTSELQSLMRSSYAVFCLKKQRQ